MPELNEAQARALAEQALKLSTAEACTVNLSGNAGGNIRYARNTVSTAGATEDLSLVVTAFYGKRSGTATANQFDAATLERTVRAAEALAKLAPEDPESMPPLGPQQYTPIPEAYAEGTARVSPEYRARVAEASIGPARERGCVAAGFLQDGGGWQAMANSAGLFAYHRATSLNFSVTMRTEDGTGSGYVERDVNDATRFDGAAASAIAIEKAVASREAKAIEPGKYTVIMEPLAAVDLIQPLLFSLNARQADEGRSPLSKQGGGTRLGEKLVDEAVSIWSDPWHPEVPGSPWTGDGRPQQKTRWVDKGVVQNLFYSRYWAEKQGKPATPFPSNFLMEGGSASLEQLIRETARGVLVTRFWYIRFVDPQTLLLTGLTRDGTFYVEDGKIKHAVKNFRFNESPIIMLNNVDALGTPVRMQGNLVPPMRIRDFTFTSLSDAV
ncbi:MAG: TldD/PmbA family protein [Gemmatimonadetes bacterium]|nr:TldD/PmbA family protein [Gemmatimonadota bacterium]